MGQGDVAGNMARLRIAALISGRGSNLRALLDACAAADFPAQIVLVLSNVADAGGLRHAEAAGVATAIVDHRRFAGRSAFEHAMEAEIAATGAEAIFLAGFMRLLTPGFVDRWRDRLVN
ncbi:MAG: formyltransferase family protein, partial [Alphaproteobacteria bacterium]